MNVTHLLTENIFSLLKVSLKIRENVFVVFNTKTLNVNPTGCNTANAF